MTPTAALPVPALSPEVLTFAAEKGVSAYLPAVAAMTRRIYPHQRIDVLVKDDPELSYNREILFEIDEAGMTSEEMGNGYRQWSEQIFQNCPATHVHVFSMILASLS